jgi:hypothetical protein
MISFLSTYLVADLILYQNGRKWTPLTAFERAMAVLPEAALIWDQYM